MHNTYKRSYRVAIFMMAISIAIFGAAKLAHADGFNSYLNPPTIGYLSGVNGGYGYPSASLGILNAGTYDGLIYQGALGSSCIYKTQIVVRGTTHEVSVQYSTDNGLTWNNPVQCASYGSYMWIRFTFDTPITFTGTDEILLNNDWGDWGRGAVLNYLYLPPQTWIATSLRQFEADGVTPITESTTTMSSTVVFKAIVDALSTRLATVEVELRRVDGQRFLGSETTSTYNNGQNWLINFAKGGQLTSFSIKDAGGQYIYGWYDKCAPHAPLYLSSQGSQLAPTQAFSTCTQIGDLRTYTFSPPVSIPDDSYLLYSEYGQLKGSAQIDSNQTWWVPAGQNPGGINSIWYEALGVGQSASDTSTTSPALSILSSEFVSPGTQVTLTRTNLTNGTYRWHARTVDIQGNTSEWQEFGDLGNPDFIVKEKTQSQYWSAINSNTLNMRDSASLQGTTIKTLPSGWVVKVLQTADASNMPIDVDGYRWYQIQDATDGSTGWMAAGQIQNGQLAVSSLQYDPAKQDDFERIASQQLDTRDARMTEIVNAVDRFVGAPNTKYGVLSGDVWKKLILGIAAQESGGIDFKNDFVSFDYGHGIMQISFAALWNEPDEYQKNSWDIRGKGSSVTIPLCQSVGSNLYMRCYKDAGTGDTNAKPYKTYGDIAGNPTYKQYSNTPQSVDANIDDGLALLSSSTRAISNFKDQSVQLNINGVITTETITAQEMQAISAVFKYNQGTKPNKTQAVYEVWNGLQNGNYPGDTWIASKYKVSSQWVQAVKDDYGLMVPPPTFKDFLKVETGRHLLGDPLYLSHIAGKIASSPFGAAYQDSLLAQKLKAVNESAVILSLRSPAELRIVDTQGRITGLVDGIVRQDIPNTFYDADNETATVLFGESDYKYEVIGKQQGVYGLSVHKVNSDDTITPVNAVDIPTNPSEVHAYSIDWQALVNGQQGVIVQIDANGDGITDRTVHAGSELTDITQPQINVPVLQDQYQINTSLQLQFSATDMQSDVAGVTATLNGVSVSSGQVVILEQQGLNTLQIVAVDTVGNVATSTQTFAVTYNFTGFQSPVKADGSGIYKTGRTLPVKFQLNDANGNKVSSAIAKLYIAKISDGIVGTEEIALSTSVADIGNLFRYDGSQYIFNLDTSQLVSGAWQLQAVLNDVKQYTVNISTKN